MTFTNGQMERYSRHIILKEVGVKGQQKLLAGKVLIIGAGGLGSPAALYLAAAGVGTIGIADPDTVELSNLQRQIIHTSADLGKPKVRSAQETMNAMNREVAVIPYHEKIDSANITGIIGDKDYDFILDCTDNFPAKFLINDACVMLKKPFSHGGIIRFQGQLLTYVPDAGNSASRGPCYRCLFQSPPPAASVPSCREAGVLGVLAGVIGALQATEAMKYLLGLGGLLRGQLLSYNALTMDFRKIKVPANPRCPVCGSKPSITTLVDYEQAVCRL